MNARSASLLACLWAWPVAAEQGRLTASIVEATPEKAVAEGEVELQWLGHRFLAERLVIREEADDQIRFKATDFLWTPCGCEVAPWSVSGATAEGVLDDHVVVRRGAFRVCDVPVLPLPLARFSLDERSPRVLLPEARLGDSGAVVGLPVWVPVGSVGHAVLTPEWWSRRWLRQRVEVEVPVGDLAAAVSKDAPMAPVRGQADLRGGHDDGRLRAAADVAWASDPSVRTDYGARFLERSTPFDERLMVAGVGPLRIESDTFDRGELQRPVAAVVSLGGLAIGPSSLSTYGRIDAIEDGARVHRQVAAGATWGLGLTSTWAEVDAEGLVEAAQADDGNPYTRAGLGGALLLPTWADLGAHRVVSQTGVEGWVDSDQGDLFDPFGLLRPRPQWAIGPAQRSQWVSASGVPLSWSAAALWTSVGWRPQGTLSIGHRGLSGTVHADPEVQAGTVGILDEGGDLQLGVLRDHRLLQGVARTSLVVATHWRPGWTGLYDFKERRFVRQGPRLTWDPGCGCVTANLGIEWAQDMTHPSIMLRLDLHARQPADR